MLLTEDEIRVSLASRPKIKTMDDLVENFNLVAKAQLKKVAERVDDKVKEIGLHIEELKLLRQPLIDRIGSWTDEEDRFMLDSVDEIVHTPNLIKVLGELRQSILDEVK